MKRINPENLKPLTMDAWLVGDLRLKIGAITLTTGDTIEDFAKAAYRMASGSLKRLMQPKWKIEVIEPSGVSHGFGLEKWNKLIDKKADEDRQRALSKKAQAKAAKIYGLTS